MKPQVKRRDLHLRTRHSNCPFTTDLKYAKILDATYSPLLLELLVDLPAVLVLKEAEEQHSPPALPAVHVLEVWEQVVEDCESEPGGSKPCTVGFSGSQAFDCQGLLLNGSAACTSGPLQ